MKFVQRFYQLAGALPAGPALDADLSLGSFLPSDRARVIETVAQLYAAGLVSLETSVRMLVEQGGVPVDDVAAEIADIQKRSFAAAVEFADATGVQQAVRKFLQLKDPQVSPEVVLPGQPNANPAAGGSAA